MATAVRNLPPGHAFEPSGHQIITQYLAPKALRGDTTPGHVAEGVDVFSASPPALPFHPSSRRRHGEAWGYLYGAQASGDARPAPGGCWARYGPEKGYVHGTGAAAEAVAFRSRFAFHVPRRGGDGRAAWAPTPWLMKEYRLNKGAAAFRAAQPHRKADMDCVVRKIFTNPVVVADPPAPPCSSDEEDPSGPDMDEEDDGWYGEEDRKRVGCSIEGPPRKRARPS
ncbi:hypothetical protein ACQJBY_010665 [Aegilops geniculata]